MLTTHIATEYALYLILHIRFCPLPREFVINGCRCADNCPWRLPDAHLADDIPPWGRTHTPGIWLKLNVGGCFGQAAALSGDAWFHNHGILGCCGPDGMIYDVFELTSTSCKWVVLMLSCVIVSYITPVFFGCASIRGSQGIHALGVLTTALLLWQQKWNFTIGICPGLVLVWNGDLIT